MAAPGAPPPPGRPPGRGPSSGYGLFVVVIAAGYLIFSGANLVASLKAHSRQTAQASGEASSSASAPASGPKPPALPPTPSASIDPTTDLYAPSDACLKLIKASDWDGAKKSCLDGLESAKDPKVLRALHFNLAAIARHEHHLDVATKSYLDALSYDYTDEVRDALAQVSTWKATERRADATITGKKSSTATLFKQPGTKSEKVKSLPFGAPVKTIACVSGGKETWCSASVADDAGGDARGWIAQSRLSFEK